LRRALESVPVRSQFWKKQKSCAWQRERERVREERG